MVVLNRIYTKTGDLGTTALGDGQRRPKFDLRIDAYGTVDETNTTVGLARLHTQDDDVNTMLLAIQNDLFDLGADLCTPISNTPPAYAPLRIIEAQVNRLERDIDQLNASLQPLRSFVLPGGCLAAAFLHQSRTVCRRAERLMVHLAQMPNEVVGAPALKYINRLSDFLFVASRYVNNHGADDVLWIPGKHR